ncbi:MAG TPA: DUF4260 family protein [Candidatus Thermoplasmatota archaeon]|jgi:hypothetical protein|nr:DUF4260 family protein [Candidatus Thermoplasmatota archaeon]
MAAELTRDAHAPGWGPGFARFTSWPYRLEWIVATLLLAGALFGWRMTVHKDLDLAATAAWIVLPDLVFLPIAFGMRGGRRWPRWGSLAYNATHSFVVFALVFGAVSLAAWHVAWPMLGWALHLSADRALGFWLRAGPRDQLAGEF